MSEEELEVVDRDNKVIGIEKRSVVLKKGLLHRASHVFIINSQKEIFLQKRQIAKSSWPGKWDLSVGETLKPKESFEEGAMRGISEELGICQINFIKIRDTYYNGYKDTLHTLAANGFFQLFVGHYDGEIELDSQEIEAGDFYSIANIQNMMKNPSQFTPWFLYDWKFFIKWHREKIYF